MPTGVQSPPVGQTLEVNPRLSTPKSYGTMLGMTSRSHHCAVGHSRCQRHDQGVEKSRLSPLLSLMAASCLGQKAPRSLQGSDRTMLLRTTRDAGFKPPVPVLRAARPCASCRHGSSDRGNAGVGRVNHAGPAISQTHAHKLLPMTGPCPILPSRK